MNYTVTKRLKTNRAENNLIKLEINHKLKHSFQITVPIYLISTKKGKRGKSNDIYLELQDILSELQYRQVFGWVGGACSLTVSFHFNEDRARILESKLRVQSKIQN